MISFECISTNPNERCLLGINFPPLRKKFDGKDKEYLKELSNLYLKLMDKLMEKSVNKESYKQWLLGTDFFHAPSSIRYHSAFDGGLLYHSLLVAECVAQKVQEPIWADILSNTSLEKIIFAALTHDFCKINFYSEETRNKKVNNSWEQVKVYGVNEVFPYGHGEKSVYLIEHHFFRLDEELAQAIRGHMGFSLDVNENNYLFQNIVAKCPLALALSEADQESSMLYEYQEINESNTITNGNDY